MAGLPRWAAFEAGELPSIQCGGMASNRAAWPRATLLRAASPGAASGADPVAVQKLFLFDVLTDLFLLVFLVSHPNNCCQDRCQRDFFPVFSSRSFTVLSLMFKFGVNFCEWCSNRGSVSFFLHVTIQFSQHPLLKRLSFPY